MRQFTLAAFSAERRGACIAIFHGTQLDSTSLKHLPEDAIKAANSVRELIARTLEHHHPEFIAISAPDTKAGERVRTFCEAVKEIARQAGLPVHEVDALTLMTHYGYPVLTRKEQVRRVGRVIWPALNTATAKSAVVDAAVAGLYVQTERLFSFYEAEA